MKLAIKLIHGDHYHWYTATLPDALTDKVIAIHNHGYTFAAEGYESFTVVTIERKGEAHELDLAIIRKPAEFEVEMTKLIDRAYEVISHEAFPASDAVLTTPFVPFDGEIVTNDEPLKQNPHETSFKQVRAVRHIDDIAWDNRGSDWKNWE